MSLIAHKFKQFEQEYLSLVMSFKDIQRSSEVLIYGEHIYGYQRPLDRKHYLNIKKALFEDKELLPTSIILSVNKHDINELIQPFDSRSDLVQLKTPSHKIFRIVDGQHRIKGLEEASKEDPNFLNFMLNVIILITEEENRVLEVEVFRDINSKAKKVKTDLTLLAEHNYRLLGQKEIKDKEELIKHMSIKVAYFLNEPNELQSKVWNNAIKFDINAPGALGIIGISAFVNSLRQIVNYYIETNMKDRQYINEKELIKYADDHSKKIADFINQAWVKVSKKWVNCFKEQIVNDINHKPVKINYSKGYYLQKTTGVNAIHSILWECLEDHDFSDEVIKNFEHKIFSSTIEEKDWGVGGIFAGLTSQSGFKKAKNIILKEFNLG
ncbi:MAG: DGQHR domain-containing protein [Bacillaceae bacterium]|nr:DGQHR domain-containing protein [Bacillaceae bacterium]